MGKLAMMIAKKDGGHSEYRITICPAKEKNK